MARSAWRLGNPRCVGRGHNPRPMTDTATPFVPPQRDGVAASRVGVHRRFARLDAFLAERFPQVADWHQRLARGDPGSGS